MTDDGTELLTINLGHDQVGEDDVRPLPANAVQRLQAVVRGLHPASCLFKNVTEDFPDNGAVIHNQYV